MSDVIETNQVEDQSSKKRKNARTILLILAIITSPLICCGGLYLVNAMPNSPIPNFFQGEALVENASGETLYLTAITTTYGYPRVISQSGSFRQSSIPLQTGESIVLTYDTADMPLAGIAVCNEDEECRLLEKHGSSNPYYVDSFESLPRLDQTWLQAIHLHPRYNIYLLAILGAALLPVVFFLWWLYLGRKTKQETNNTR